jgi:DNA-binding NtrC family response regulator
MNGVQLAHWFREREPDLPVLVVTGSPELATGDGRFHPSFVCLAKPLLVERLTGTIGQMLAARAA